MACWVPCLVLRVLCFVFCVLYSNLVFGLAWITGLVFFRWTCFVFAGVDLFWLHAITKVRLFLGFVRQPDPPASTPHLVVHSIRSWGLLSVCIKHAVGHHMRVSPRTVSGGKRQNMYVFVIVVFLFVAL